MAASDPRISDRVHFINAFGPFFYAESLLLQVASRDVVYEGESTRWEPDPLTLQVLANELIETLDNSHDADILTSHYLNGQPATEAELAELSVSGRTVSDPLEGVEPREAESLYSSLPASFRKDLANISPSNHVGGLRARLPVIHGHYDQAVPVVESRRLVEATADRIDVRYTEFLAFEHVRPGTGGLFTRIGQAVRLYRHMYGIIRIAS